MRSRTYIMLVLAAGFCLIVALFIITPATAGLQLPAIIVAIGGLIPVLAKLGETEAKIDSAIVVSQHNAAALETVSTQVDENTIKTEAVHTIVNSQRTEMMAKIEELAHTVAELRKDRAVADVEHGANTDQAVESVIPPKDETL